MLTPGTDLKDRHGSGCALVAHSLVKRYKHGATPALNHFDLQVKEGEFYGLLGPNGAGKSTLISILSGLSQPDSGTALIMGLDPRHKLAEIKQFIGLAPQDIALYDKLTARENLIFLGKIQGIGGKELHDRIAQCLEFIQLVEHAQKPVATFSGGMKRRLNLGAALLNKPRILFLDEPTVGIDIQSRHLIYGKLAELNRAGTTIFYTTHYVREAQELCSRIGIIDYGRLVQEGSTEQLLKESSSENLDDLLLRLSGRQQRDT